MKTVYLLLTRSATIFSRVIRLFTAAPYTHVSISVAEDPDAFLADPRSGFYSFGRKNPYLPFPAGFIRETRDGGYFQCFPDTRCILLALDVPDAKSACVCRKWKPVRGSITIPCWVPFSAASASAGKNADGSSAPIL